MFSEIVRMHHVKQIRKHTFSLQYAGHKSALNNFFEMCKTHIRVTVR